MDIFSSQAAAQFLILSFVLLIVGYFSFFCFKSTFPKCSLWHTAEAPDCFSVWAARRGEAYRRIVKEFLDVFV